MVVLGWSFNLDDLAGFFGYSQQSSGTAFVDLPGLPVFSGLEVVMWKRCSNKMLIIRFLLCHFSFTKLICYSKGSILLFSLFSVRSGILLRVTVFISALTSENSWMKKFFRISNVSNISAIGVFLMKALQCQLKAAFL